MGIKSLDLNHHTVRSVEVPPKDILYSKKIQSRVMVYGYRERERRPLPQVWESVVDARIDSASGWRPEYHSRQCRFLLRVFLMSLRLKML